MSFTTLQYIINKNIDIKFSKCEKFLTHSQKIRKPNNLDLQQVGGLLFHKAITMKPYLKRKPA
jgi:hypothetical protein